MTTIVTRNVFEADLPVIASMSDEYEADPHRLNREALEQAPVAIGPFGPELLSYDAVHLALRDRRFRMPAGLALDLQGITAGPVWERAARSILAVDGDQHQRLRRLVSRAFTPRPAEELRPLMTEVINGIVDDLGDAARCDVVTDIARRYPTPIVCQLLGAPPQDWELFAVWTDDIFKLFGFNVVADSPDILRAFDELDAYVDAMVDARRETLTDDLLSKLILAEDEGDRLTRDQLRMLVSAVLSAGTDTTRNQLAAALDVFCDHPDQWSLLAERPELAPQAVEEVMRHSPVVFGTARVAADDVEMCGLLIPAQTLVMVSTSAANRDPAVYIEADRFDITRPHPRPMLTFGGGIHYCLGVHLAKAELAVALAVLARRLPGLRRVGPAPWKPTFGISGPATLPVAFDPVG